MKAVAAAVVLASLAGCAHMPSSPSSMNLDQQLSFADPVTCEASAPHVRLLSGMVAGDANKGFRAGRVLARTEAKRAFGRIEVKRYDGWWTIALAVRGTLFGLTLTQIIQTLPEGGDPSDVTYMFAHPVAHVERVLRARGFPAQIGKEVQLGPPDGYAHLMTLLSDPDDATRTMFGCGYS